MNNQKVWYLDLGKQRNNMYFFDLGFTGKKDFAEFFKLNQIPKKDRTEKQIEKMKSYVKEASQIADVRSSFQVLDDSLLPATMYVTFEFDRNVVLRDFFQINSGYLIMSEAFAKVLLSCNLGKTQAIPIRFYDLFHDEYVNDTTYYLLNVAEKHHYFLPQSTYPMPFLHYQKDGYDIYQSALEQSVHDTYMYSDKALSCPVDLWHEPSFLGSLLLSDKLKQALEMAGLDKCVNLWECQLESV